LQTRIEELKKELKNKDKIISMLRQCVIEKNEVIKSIGSATVPHELLLNWTIMQKFFSPSQLDDEKKDLNPNE